MSDTILEGTNTDSASVEIDGMCQLVPTDKQCGHIFFNKQSLLLKYHCKYCLGTYDNISVFCAHLSEHIFADNKEIHFEIQRNTDRAETYVQSHDNEYEETENGYGITLTDKVENELNREEINYESFNSSNDIESLNYESLEDIDIYNNDMVVEELDESDEIATKLDKEVMLNEEVEKREQQCVRGMSRLDIISKPRNRKVTTVKVIAVRNRITDLYERIKAEQENKTKLSETNSEIEGKKNQPEYCLNISNMNLPLTTVDTSSQQVKNINNSADVRKSSSDNGPTSYPQKFVQKIIGETVITLIPEGCKIPEYTSPSALNEMQQNHSKSNINIKKQEQDECTCPACGKQFRSSFSLAIHKRSHYLESNSNIKLAHKCSDCDRLFNKISELREHVERVHFPDGFVCKICYKQLTSLNLLEIHMRKVHLKRSLSCNHCGQTFENLAAYDSHANIPNGCGYNYRCQICGRKYTTNRALEQHMSNHKEQVPQTCVVCGKKTLRITQHMKIHAPRPKRINKCNLCGKCFNFTSGLSTHYRVMHRQQRIHQKLRKSTVKKPSTKTTTREMILNKKEIKSDLVVADSFPGITIGNNAVLNDNQEKRVVVEMIHSGDIYKTFDDSDWSSEIDTAPPIAREETISAVNSIVENFL